MTIKTDRCDATASGTEQAYFSWIKVDKNDEFIPLTLAFCAHHNAEHSEALRSEGWEPFRDDSEDINVKPSVSANAL